MNNRSRGEAGSAGPSRGQYTRQGQRGAGGQKNAAALLNGILKERHAESPTTNREAAGGYINYGAL